MRRTLSALRKALESLDLGGDYTHKSWPGGALDEKSWNDFQLLDIYYSQVCIKKEPYKVGAQIWFVGAGTFRKFTVGSDGKVEVAFVDLEALINGKADKPKTWNWVQGQSWTGIKIGDNVAGSPVVAVDDTYFYLLLPGGIEAYKIKDGLQDNKVPGIFLTRQEVQSLPQSYSEQEITGKYVALSSVKTGDKINGYPVVSVSNSYVECSLGTSGFVRYMLEGSSVKTQLFNYANNAFLSVN